MTAIPCRHLFAFRISKSNASRAEAHPSLLIIPEDSPPPPWVQLPLAAMTFWVNERCIDCGTCWQWDPQHFAPAPRGDAAHVWRQPEGEPETTRALLALRACPVTAIQAPADQVRRTPADGFPALLTRHPAGEVYYCGLDVRWLLPGHGGQQRFEPGEWASQIDGLLRSWGPSAAAAAPVADAAALPCVASD